MALAAKAWRLREGARAALRGGNFSVALELAAWAQELQGTQAGESLRTVGELLREGAEGG